MSARYDQCDATCTTDCGHCKGAGRPAGMSAPTFTERQSRDWPDAIARIRQHGVHVEEDPTAYGWQLDWHEEVRPGRGHYLSAVWNDGEHFAQVVMDVYGSPSVSVAALDWIHSDADEECGCGPCEAEREADR